MDEKQLLKEVVDYLLRNRYRRIGIQEISEYIGYGTSAFGHFFRTYFEISFAKYMRKLNLREAAKEIAGSREPLDLIGKRNGFMSKNFFAAFQEEFGVQPKDFRGKKVIPDLSCKTKINRRSFTISYETLEDMEIEGYPLKAVHGKETDLMGEAGYAFLHPNASVDLEAGEKQFGIWWHDRKKGDALCYVFGPEAGKESPKGKDNIRIHVKGGNYAVFAIERGANYFEIAKNSRELAWYAFTIWQRVNEKQTDKMGFTYEAFDQNFSYLYIPLLRGFGGIEVRNESIPIMEKVIRYVDENVLDIYDADQVADYFGRSQFLIRDQFQSCFRMPLSDYIRKKRLYVLAGMLQKGIIRQKDITGRYLFKSMNQFQKEFRKAFGQDWENYEHLCVKLPDLKSYYNDNFSNLQMSIVNIDDFSVITKTIKSSEKKEEIDLDIPGLAAFWMTNDMPELEGSGYQRKEKENREMVSFYKNVCKNSKDRVEYHYVLGPVREEEKEIPKSMESTRIKGGKYIVFESIHGADEDSNLAELMRTMMRCVDYVWIYDNWMRTDFQSRISFWKYEKCKIHYYIPVYY